MTHENAPEDKKTQIANALSVCAELTGTQFSKMANYVMLKELMAFETAQVLHALNRCRRELHGRLTLAAVLERIETGLPSADEAFGLLTEGWRNDALTVVVPEIALLAAGDGAGQLWNAGDKTGARMAFREAYTRRQTESMGQPARWAVSAGTDREQRVAAVMAAVKSGRLPESVAAGYLPAEASEERLLLETGQVLSLEDKRKGRERVNAALALLEAKRAEKEAARQEAAEAARRKAAEWEAKLKAAVEADDAAVQVEAVHALKQYRAAEMAV